MAGALWTEKEELVLNKMSEKGFTLDEMSAVLKSRTSNSISSKLTVLGLPRATPQPTIDYALLEQAGITEI